MPKVPRVPGVPTVRRPPSRWLIENADLLPRGGRALDVAAGHGRHALWLAATGLAVDAIDRDEAVLASIDRAARAAGWHVTTYTRDLECESVGTEGPGVSLARSAYDVVLVFNYLHRPLLPALRDALKPGGLLFYETFLIGQAERGHPKNPAFLLHPGELVELVFPLTILRSREGEVDGSLVASIVARRQQ